MSAQTHTDVFTDYIRRSPGVCDGCFARVSDETPPPSDSWFEASMDRRNRHSMATLKGIAGSTRVPGPNGEHCYPPPGERSRSRGRIVCADCGNVDAEVRRGFAPGLLAPDLPADAALPKCALLEAVERCAARLREQGVPVDAGRALSKAKAMKETPEYGTRDADITRLALDVATGQ